MLLGTGSRSEKVLLPFLLLLSYTTNSCIYDVVFATFWRTWTIFFFFCPISFLYVSLSLSGTLYPSFYSHINYSYKTKSHKTKNVFSKYMATPVFMMHGAITDENYFVCQLASQIYSVCPGHDHLTHNYLLDRMITFRVNPLDVTRNFIYLLNV